jgi:hypothetical protein
MSMRETTAAMQCCGDDDALLLCGEDAGELEQRDGDSGRQVCWAAAGGFRKQLVPDEERCPDVSVTWWEAACPPAPGCPGRPRSDGRPAGWAESVSWILKVQQHHCLRWLASAMRCLKTSLRSPCSRMPDVFDRLPGPVVPRLPAGDGLPRRELHGPVPVLQ